MVLATGTTRREAVARAEEGVRRLTFRVERSAQDAPTDETVHPAAPDAA